MIAAVAALLVCQLFGEILVRALSLPLPGPVAGMGLMFGLLLFQGRRKTGEDRVPPAIGAVADMLLRNLSLLFIPAAVGVVQYLGLLRAYAGTIAVSVVISTTAALIATVAVFRFVSRLHAVRHGRVVEGLERAAEIEQGQRDKR